MQFTVDISRDVLDWVRAQSGDTGLPEKITGYLSNWLEGTKKPTFNQVEQVSKATGIPFGYFFFKKPPVENLSIVEYRTIDSTELLRPSRNLIDTRKHMEAVQDWMHNYLKDKIDPHEYVGSMKNRTDIYAFANKVLDVLNLKGEWRRNCHSAADLFRKIRIALSNAGVIVMMNGIVGNNTHRTLSVNEFRAFAMVDDLAPLIFINSNDSMNGKVFSLLHEFAHICLGENSLFNESLESGPSRKKNEIICNAVASEVLIPSKRFLEDWNASDIVDLEDRSEALAKLYCCGVIVVARKALDNNLIDRQMYAKVSGKIVSAYREAKRKQGGGGDFYRNAASRLDHDFLFSLAESVDTGKTTYTEAFGLTNTNRKTYANLMNQIGGLYQVM